MSKKEILKLIIGFRRFREKYFASEHSLYEKLSTDGQTPKTLIIGCSDSRVDPAIITSASPGELFIVRNVASLVPPYETGGLYHGVSAAIEFAVVNLKVENVIVLGHRQCGGIRALMTNQPSKQDGFVQKWVRIAQDAKERVLKKYPKEDIESQCRHCEMEAIVSSIQNLKTFPFIQEAVNENRLALLGIYFDLESGQLFEWDAASDSFQNIEV